MHIFVRAREIFCRTLMLLAMLLLFSVTVYADDNSGGDHDFVHFVFVLDRSMSMEGDDEKLALAALRMCADILPIDNAMVGAVAFGPNFGKEYSYSYVKNRNGEPVSVDMADRVAVLSPFVSTKEWENVNDFKETINIADMGNDDSVTTIGAAVLAAVDMLKEANANPEKSCIVLVSDGRITGENRWEEEYHFYAINQQDVNYSKNSNNDIEPLSRNLAMTIEEIIKPEQWKVYCLETDHKGLNEILQGDEGFRGRVALNYIASDFDKPISKETIKELVSITAPRRKYIERVEDLVKTFTEMLVDFYKGSQSLEASKISQDNYEAVYTFEVPPLATESNIVVSGRDLERMKIQGPGYFEEFPKQGNNGIGNSSAKDRYNSDTHYTILKIVHPAAGDWKITLYGGMDWENIHVQAFSVENPSLIVSSAPADTVDKYGEIKLEAYFEHMNERMNYDPQYIDMNIEVTLNGETKSVPMKPNPNGDSYEVSYSPNQAGKLVLHAVARRKDQQDIICESKELTYDVTYVPMSTSSSSIPPVTVGCCSQELTGDVSPYWINPSGDNVLYNFISPSVTGFPTLSFDAKSGVFTVKNEKNTAEGLIVKKPYVFTIQAKTADMQEWVSQTMEVTVINNLPELKDLEPANPYKLYVGVPSFLQRWFSSKLTLEEPFIHPAHQDNKSLGIVSELTGSELFNIEIDDNSNAITITALKRGEEKVKLIATELCGGESVMESITLVAVGWKTSWLFPYLLLLILLLLIAAFIWYVFSIRRVRCKMNIRLEYSNKRMIYTVTDIRLGAKDYRYLRKSKLAVGNLVRYIIQNYDSVNGNSLSVDEQNMLIAVPGKNMAIKGTWGRDGSPLLINIPKKCTLSIDGIVTDDKKVLLSPEKNVTLTWQEVSVNMSLTLTHRR